MDNLELKVVFSAVDKFLRPVNAITSGARAASKELRATKDALKALNDQQKLVDNFRSTNKALGIDSQRLEEARLKVKGIAEAMGTTAAPTAQMQRSFAAAREEASRLSANVNRLSESKQRLRQQLSAVGIDTKQLAGSQRDLKGKLELATSAVNKQSEALEAANKKMQRLKAAQADLAKSRETAGKLQGTGAKLMAGGAAITAAGSIPVMAYAKAEDAATQLQVALMRSNGEVGESYKAINDLANQLGNKLPGTTSDYQNMMTMLVRQGMSSKAILGGLGEATALLGVQLKMPMEAAAEFASKLQDATRTTEKDMLGLMDVIQRTFYLGVDQNNMLEAFKGLGPVMDMIKVKGLEGTKALAPFVVMMDQAGMRGESAGNAIRKVVGRSMNRDFINKLLEDMKKFEGFKDKSLKLDFTDGNGEFGGFDKMMAELNKLKKYDTVTRLQLLSRIYGDDKETNEVLSKIIEQGKDGYNEVIAKMQAQADLRTRVDKQLNTLNNLWDAASGTFTNAIVAFGESIAPELHATAVWLGKVAGGVQAWAKENPKLAAGIMTVVKWIGLGLIALGGLAVAAGTILGPLALLKFSMVTLGISGSGALSMLGGGFNIVMRGIGMLGAALMAHPILALISLIAAGAIYIWQNWDTLGPKFFALVDKISGYFGGLKDRALESGRQMIDGMIDGITGRWEALRATVVGVADASIGWIKEKLGIKSPSRVFAELGGYTMQGFEQGLVGGENGPLGAISGMSKKLAGIVAGVAIGGASMAGDFQLDGRPPINTSALAGSRSSAGGGDTFIFNISAGPGMDERTLARAVRDEFSRARREEESRSRSRLRDSE